VDVPANKPLTTPVPDTEAVNGLTLLQAPGKEASVKFVVLPTHTASTPVITGGAATTVTI
jgi:hypothetical protein